MLKTFYTGVGGWADRQLPDGTVIWTAPSGQVYTTKPGGALFFPALATPTGQLVLPESSGPAQANRGLMMPTGSALGPKNAQIGSPWNDNTTPPASPENDSSSPSASPETTNHHPSDVERAAKQAIESC